MLGLAVVWQLVDLGSFALMVATHGIEAERNPVAHLLTPYGAVLVKVALVVFLIRIYPYLGRYQLLIAGLAVVVGVIGSMSNLATM